MDFTISTILKSFLMVYFLVLVVKAFIFSTLVHLKNNKNPTPTRRALVPTKRAETYWKPASLEEEVSCTFSKTCAEMSGNNESNKFWNMATSPNAVPSILFIIQYYTLSSSMKMGMLGMMTLAKKANASPRSTRGKTEIAHSFKQLGSMAKLKWVMRKTNVPMRMYLALLPLKDI